MKWLGVVAGLSLAPFVVPATQVAAAETSSACPHPSRPFAYHWPIKPFETQHPIRGGFGDPRIVSLTQPFGWTGPHQTSANSFHNGIDIGAAPWTPVYPVVSGRVVRATEGQIVVRTDDGRSFQYYHLWRAPAVQKARCVEARRTVLGWITEKRGHLHLAEIDGSVVHNPLDRGHLEPYRDRTRPAATELYLDDGTQPTRTLNGRPIGPEDLLAVHVTEAAPMPMPGGWFDLPQVPALVEWRLFHGDTRTAWRTAVDFRHTEPPPRAFWEIYGAGTYQNCPQFEHHNYLTTPGRYLIRLRIHPSRLHAGLYRIAVRVADIRGNRSTAWWSIRIVH